MSTHYYTAYNLIIASELPSPQLMPLPKSEEMPDIDVHIRYGEVPKVLAGAVSKGVLYQAKPNEFLLHLQDIAGFWVRNGKEIIIDPAQNVTDDEVRLFLFGSAFGALLHQRGLLVLHASAIETKHGAVLFVGASGNGKSTTAAAFHQRGYSVLSDDVCVIILDKNNNPVVLPAFPQIKLWADTVKELAHEKASLRKVRPQLEKYALMLEEGFATTSRPLYAVYALSPHNKEDFKLTPVEDGNKFRILLNNTYRGRFMDGLKMRDSHFSLAVVAANKIKVSRVSRPSAPFRIKELIDLLEADFEDASPTS